MLKVSVITSVYACAQFLETCIQTVRNQTYGEVEHVLVSLASPEAQAEEAIIERLKYPGLFYYHYPEWGNLTQAWNKAIGHATGDLIANLNSDDWMDPEAYAIMASYFEVDPDLGLVYTDLVCHAEDGSSVFYHKKDEWNGSKATEWCGPMPMWRKSLHAKLGMMDERFIHVADFDWWCRVSHHSKLQRVPKYLSHYLVRKSSLEHQGLQINRVQNEREVVMQRLRDGYYRQPFH